MLERMSDFLLDEGIREDAEEAYAQMFGSREGFSPLMEEMEGLIGDWREPAHLRREWVVFSPMVEPPQGELLERWPMADPMKMRTSDVCRIPAYIREHPYSDDGRPVDNRWDLSLPLILTTSDSLLSSWAYTPDGEPNHRPALLAAILYEMSLLDETIAGGDGKKTSIIDGMGRGTGDDGADVEELLAAAARAPQEKDGRPQNPCLDALEISRYNARLGMYERLHFDLSQILCGVDATGR